MIFYLHYFKICGIIIREDPKGGGSLKLHINRQGVTLAEAISDEINLYLPCGGKGKCGKCAVKASGELDTPSKHEKALLATYPDGWRLSCKAVCMGEIEVEIDDTKLNVLADFTDNFGAMDPLSKGEIGVAIDIGTTTLAAKLISTETGKVLATAGIANPQAKYGGDVMTRIDFAVNGGTEELKSAIVSGLTSLLSDLTSDYIDTAVITGNTTMLTFLTGGDAEGLARAPFIPSDKFGRFVSGGELGLGDKLGRAYLVPCISAFVGGDITSAIIGSELTEAENAMLADIGTNGEICLQRGGRLICTSTAAGPAFEGAEITFGMTARDGAISDVRLSGDDYEITTVGNAAPLGICAGGLVSAVARLLEKGILDESGYLENNVYLTDKIYIAPSDIRKLQTAKAAVRAGTDILCGDIPCNRLYLAGGIGNYLNIADGVKIGLIPPETANKVIQKGNAALTGACMILQDESLIGRAEKIVREAEVIELDTEPGFAEAYIDNMTF